MFFHVASAQVPTVIQRNGSSTRLYQRDDHVGYPPDHGIPKIFLKTSKVSKTQKQALKTFENFEIKRFGPKIKRFYFRFF